MWEFFYHMLYRYEIFLNNVYYLDKDPLFLLLDDGFWGCGTNKYGQLGKLQQDFESTCNFIKLNIQPLDVKMVKKFKCHEWGTAIITE